MKAAGRGYFNAMASRESTRQSQPTLFGLLDRNQTRAMAASLAWTPGWPRSLTSRISVTFNRAYAEALPYFSGRRDVAGEAGIAGTSRDSQDWGPPALSFSSGFSGLNDSIYSRQQKQSVGVAAVESWRRGRHEYHFGFDHVRQQQNRYGQSDPRGSFGFTGAATGSDFADFLFGVPDTASIAYGNADKYLRSNQSNAYLSTDTHITGGLTVNAGVRWEYASPFTERYGRLANLEAAPGFTAVAPVVAASPVGSLTGTRYPVSLLRPFRSMAEPRVSLAWLPIGGSSLVVRAAYGIYADTGVYDTISAQMAQQPPLSKSFASRNSAAAPLALGSALVGAAGAQNGTYAVEAGFRPGYAQNWQASVEQGLAWGLVVKVGYLGIKGTHARQSIYPNTYPAGGAAACATCPSGFEYLLSGGNSSRHAGQVQVRRRLHGGLAASAQVTWAKALDNAALGGGAQAPLVAQNWLDLGAERALSSFDERVNSSAQFEYTTAIANGWRGRLLGEWRLTSEMTATTGKPLTPIYAMAVGGAGFVGNLRPDYSGASVYDAPGGLALNPAAYSAPAAGGWGNAGRNSIRGPNQLAWNAALGRTLRVGDRLSADVRMNASNLLNHVNFTRWDTTFHSALFGQPTAANAMRVLKLETTVRF
jgi:hypothetical protein